MHEENGQVVMTKRERLALEAKNRKEAEKPEKPAPPVGGQTNKDRSLKNPGSGGAPEKTAEAVNEDKS